MARSIPRAGRRRKGKSSVSWHFFLPAPLPLRAQARDSQDQFPPTASRRHADPGKHQGGCWFPPPPSAPRRHRQQDASCGRVIARVCFLRRRYLLRARLPPPKAALNTTERAAPKPNLRNSSCARQTSLSAR